MYTLHSGFWTSPFCMHTLRTGFWTFSVLHVHFSLRFLIFRFCLHTLRTGFLDFFFRFSCVLYAQGFGLSRFSCILYAQGFGISRFSCVPYAQGLDSSLFCIYILRTGSRTLLALHVHSAHTVLVFPWFHMYTLCARFWPFLCFALTFCAQGWLFTFLQTFLHFACALCGQCLDFSWFCMRCAICAQGLSFFSVSRLHDTHYLLRFGFFLGFASTLYAQGLGIFSVCFYTHAHVFRLLSFTSTLCTGSCTSQFVCTFYAQGFGFLCSHVHFALCLGLFSYLHLHSTHRVFAFLCLLPLSTHGVLRTFLCLHVLALFAQGLILLSVPPVHSTHQVWSFPCFTRAFFAHC